MAAQILAVLFRGGTAPVVWIIGLVLIIAGVVAMVRRGILLGVVLVVLGIILGGLQLL